MEAYGVPGNASPPVRQQTSEESATEGVETTSTPQYRHTETEGDRHGRAGKLQTTDLRALKGKDLLAFAKEMGIEVPMTSQSNNRSRTKSCTNS